MPGEAILGEEQRRVGDFSRPTWGLHATANGRFSLDHGWHVEQGVPQVIAY